MANCGVKRVARCVNGAHLLPLRGGLRPSGRGFPPDRGPGAGRFIASRRPLPCHRPHAHPRRGAVRQEGPCRPSWIFWHSTFDLFTPGGVGLGRRPLPHPGQGCCRGRALPWTQQRSLRAPLHTMAQGSLRARLGEPMTGETSLSPGPHRPTLRGLDARHRFDGGTRPGNRPWTRGQ